MTTLLARLKPWERAVTGFAIVVPFVSGKMLRGAGKAASATDEVLEGTQDALDVVAAGARATGTFGSRTWNILPYKDARKLTEGYKGSIQAHHIVENRHLLEWGMDTNLGPSVVLSRAQHQEITNRLQKLLPTGKAYTKAEVLAAYRTAYKDFPEWLEAAEELLR